MEVFEVIGIPRVPILFWVVTFHETNHPAIGGSLSHVSHAVLAIGLCLIGLARAGPMGGKSLNISDLMGLAKGFTRSSLSGDANQKSWGYQFETHGTSLNIHGSFVRKAIEVNADFSSL